MPPSVMNGNKQQYHDTETSNKVETAEYRHLADSFASGLNLNGNGAAGANAAGGAGAGGLFAWNTAGGQFPNDGSVHEDDTNNANAYNVHQYPNSASSPLKNNGVSVSNTGVDLFNISNNALSGGASGEPQSSSSLGEDLLQMHRQQILQNSGASVLQQQHQQQQQQQRGGQAHNVNVNIIRPSSSYVSLTGTSSSNSGSPALGSSSQQGTINVNGGNSNNNAAAPGSSVGIANSRWHMSSPALHNYGQYVSVEDNNNNNNNSSSTGGSNTPSSIGGGGLEDAQQQHQHQQQQRMMYSNVPMTRTIPAAAATATAMPSFAQPQATRQPFQSSGGNFGYAVDSNQAQAQAQAVYGAPQWGGVGATHTHAHSAVPAAMMNMNGIGMTAAPGGLPGIQQRYAPNPMQQQPQQPAAAPNMNNVYGGMAPPGMMQVQQQVEAPPGTGHFAAAGAGSATPPIQASSNHGNPGGVFYMAVPMQHGGQVLQPVQVVQLPNGQQTFVIASQQSHHQQPPPGQHMVASIPGSQSMPNLQHASSQYQMIGQMRQNAQQGKKKERRNPKGRSRDLAGNISEHDSYAVDDPGYDLSNPPSEAITALYQSTRRPALSELLGHVRRLSRDQVGCRLLQQSLDEDGPDAATAILQEGLPFLAEAMTDPFGNYLFQKILEKVNDEERLRLISTVSPRLVNAALNLHGTRSVQKVVEVAANDNEAAQIVTRALTPAVARLCIDSHGNHVVQRVLQRLPHPHAKFVFDAVANAVGDVARHRHGCCVIQRCLDSPQSLARSNLVKRIVEKALDLMQDAYGNYVVQYVLDVCGEDEAAAVCESVIGKVSLLAVQKFSSNVMEKCLERSGDRVQELYLQEISHPDKVRELMCDPFGNYVVQRGLAVATHSQAVRLVEAMRPHLPGMRNTAGGRRIVAKICRRFPNFNVDISSAGNGNVNNAGNGNISSLYNENNRGMPENSDIGVAETSYPNDDARWASVNEYSRN